MSGRLTTGLLTALLAVAAAWPVYGADSKQQQPAVSAKLGKPLTDAHAAMLEEQWDKALEHLNVALAVKERTAYDNYQIDEMVGFVQARRKEYAQASAAYERSLNSGFLPEDRKVERLRVLTHLNFELKDYEKAVQFGNSLLKELDQPDLQVLSLIGRAQYIANDFQGAASTMDQVLEEAARQNARIEETWLQVQMSSYVKLNNTAGAVAALKRLAVEFPSKGYWQDFFRLLKRQTDLDPRAQLNLYRLIFQIDMMEGASDYLEAGRLALRLGVPGEAVSILEAGKNRSVYTSEADKKTSRQLLQDAGEAVQVDRKSLESVEREARAAQKGEADVQLGIALIGYGQFEKGAAAIERGQKKGGLRYPGEAELMLGRALIELDREDEAEQAFERAASSENPSAGNLHEHLATLGRFWLVILRQPSAIST